MVAIDEPEDEMKKNNKADALTKKPNERLIDDTDERQKHRMQTLLKVLFCFETLSLSLKKNRREIFAQVSRYKSSAAKSTG